MLVLVQWEIRWLHGRDFPDIIIDAAVRLVVLLLVGFREPRTLFFSSEGSYRL